MQSQYNQDVQIPADDPLELGIPADLVFDDDPLEPMLAGDQPMAPTPASAVEIWRRGIDRSEVCARALVSVLVQNHDEINQLVDLDTAEHCLRIALEQKPAKEGVRLAACVGALGRVLELKQQTGEAESLYRQALGLFEQAPDSGHEIAWATGMRLLNILEASNRKEEATQLRNRLQARSLAEKEDDGSLGHLRSIALDMFLTGQHAEAEAIYRRFVEKRFELGSTHCHLARLYLMTGREQEARREVDRAWGFRHISPDYVHARIHFFKTLLQMLAGTEWQPCLLELKNTLALPGAHLDWTIQTVLVHLKPRLGEEFYEMMTAVAAALSRRSKLAELDSHPLWKSVCGGEESSTTGERPGPPAASPARGSSAQPDMAGSPSEPGDREKFTFGTITKITGQTVTIKEYDFQQDADVEREYHANDQTELGNVAKLGELATGDSVVVDYTESVNQRLIITIVKEQKDEPGASSPEPG